MVKGYYWSCLDCTDNHVTTKKMLISGLRNYKPLLLRKSYNNKVINKFKVLLHGENVLTTQVSDTLR